jgi:hypothetical protein
MTDYLNTMQAAFIDLATIDMIEELFLFAEAAERVSYFVRTSTPCTPFTIVPVPLQCHGSKTFTAADAAQQTHTVSRAGDYLLHTWLRVELPALTAATGYEIAYCPKLLHNLVKTAQGTFNDMTLTSVLDTQILDAWAAFHVDGSKMDAYNEMIGNTADLTTLADSLPAKSLNLPLPFFWSSDTGKSLPTAALPYNDINIKVTYNSLASCLRAADAAGDSATVATALPNISTQGPVSTTLWGEYGIVSGEERQMMAAAPRDMVVDFWQAAPEKAWSAPAVGVSQHIDIRFGGSVKALYAAARISNAPGSCYTTTAPGSALENTEVVTVPASGDSAIEELHLQYENTSRAHVPSDVASLVTPYYRAPAVNRSFDHVGWQMVSYTLDAGSQDPAGSSNYGKLTNASFAVKPTAAAVAALTAAVPSSFAVHVVAQMWDVVRVSGGTIGRPIL